ncbi:hypothetical protein TIFTF001_048722 [Ficus carica]|uniref:Uncharacterized protein n=1 Tax=Ficus carica TaxID=3494 RepID=A0AA87YYH3_FICCA|nr:hypothetical protein TIFTF001_048719 [Ficus carica]GMN20267.1 hypothetical protein TIFTF001_048722 [Ficus carica]
MMMKMFRSDIAKQVSAGSNPPTLVSDCIGQAIRAEYQINQDKEARIQILKAKKENKDATKKDWRLRNHRPGIMPTQRKTLKLKLHRWQQNGVLGKDNAKVDCRKRCVTSSPPG